MTFDFIIEKVKIIVLCKLLFLRGAQQSKTLYLVHLLGKNKDTDEVSDDGTKAQNRHTNPFHPKGTTLYCVVLLPIQMPTLAYVQDRFNACIVEPGIE